MIMVFIRLTIAAQVMLAVIVFNYLAYATII